MFYQGGIVVRSMLGCWPLEVIKLARMAAGEVQIVHTHVEAPFPRTHRVCTHHHQITANNQARHCHRLGRVVALEIGFEAWPAIRWLNAIGMLPVSS